jgi:predicted amidophosphoribosyltransferase
MSSRCWRLSATGGGRGGRASYPAGTLLPVACLACFCRSPERGPLCRSCSADFSPGGERRLAGGVLVRSAFAHRGTARLLVHRLKYGAHPGAASVLAAAMAATLPPGATSLVPVPRALLRRWKFGVDPAVELARALGRATGLPVVRALAPAWWHRRRAGPADAERGVPRFRAVAVATTGAVLIDDVVTTGTTLRVASAALGGVRLALTATAAPRGRTALATPGAIGIVVAKPPPGDADDGSVRAARNAPTLGPLLFPICLPSWARAQRPKRRSWWRFGSTVSA